MDAHNLSWPQFLPDGRAFLPPSVQDQSKKAGGPGGAGHGYRSVAQAWSRFPGTVSAVGTSVYHAPGVREGELHVVGFDAARHVLRGAPFSVVDSVFRARGGGAAYFAVAQTGALVYALGGLAHTLGTGRPEWPP